MVILEMTIHEGRTYNHPFEAYSNFKQGVSVKASLSENENPEREGKLLQERASLLMDEIKNKTLQSLVKLNSLEEAKRQIEIEISRVKSNNDIPF